MLLRGHRASLETGWAAEETDKEEGHPAKWLKQALFTGVRDCQPRARHATPKLTEMVLGDLL